MSAYDVYLPTHDTNYVNDNRTVLVSVWSDGTVTVASRDHPSDTWGPPVYLTKENRA